jgi:hypothetical protein
MDGGLKENSGAETAREIMTVFDSVLSQKQAVDTVYKKVKVFVLSLPNSIGKTDSLEKAKNVFELSAPLTALLNNWIGNTTKAETINAMGARSNRYWYGQIKPKPVKAAHDVTPVLPLGWQISDAAIEEMKRSLQTRNKSELRNVINVISPQ